MTRKIIPHLKIYNPYIFPGAIFQFFSPSDLRTAFKTLKNGRLFKNGNGNYFYDRGRCDYCGKKGYVFRQGNMRKYISVCLHCKKKWKLK